MNAIAPIAANDDGAVAEPAAPGTLIEFLARAVRDPSIDVHKLEAIYRMQREIVADDRREQFHDAMNAVQGEMQAVVRNALNSETRNKFATMEAVDAVVRPIYAKHGFSLSFSEAANDQPEMKIECVIRRRGHEETHHLSALSDMTGPKGTPNKTNVQGVGSSVTYLRRYLTCMIFNVALRDDNDGNRARPSNDTGELNGHAAVGLLTKLIAECSADPHATAANERAFLNAFNFPNLHTIKEIPAGEFARLKNALLDKKNRLAQRAALRTVEMSKQVAGIAHADARVAARLANTNHPDLTNIQAGDIK